MPSVEVLPVPIACVVSSKFSLLDNDLIIKTWTRLEFYIYPHTGDVSLGQSDLIRPASYHVQTGPVNIWQQSLQRIQDIDLPDLASPKLRKCRDREVVWTVPNQSFQRAGRILFWES